MEKIERRTFIKAAAIAGFPTIIPASVLGNNSPSNRITLGCIGVGGEGGRNLRNFLGNEDAQVLAVCDVWENRSKAQQNVVNKHYKGTGCKSTMDCREIIADKSIDAVVISTPDHWHVPLSLMALEAGKDVFSEKPTLRIAQ
jgi:predicted dehydrogenase